MMFVDFHHELLIAAGSKADIPSATECPLLGVKRTCLFAPQISAFDPKRTLAQQPSQLQ